MQMLLKNNYYQIIHTRQEGLQAVFHLSLLSDCPIYKGHFPVEPVSPGVCNIETIKECAMSLSGKRLMISTIKLCRLTALASPSICPEVDVIIHLSPIERGFIVTAKISDNNHTYMEYKGEMSVITD